MGAAIGALTAMDPALAADLPVKAPIRAPVVAAYNWTGCYVGGNIGYSWGRARGDFNAPDLAALSLPTSYPISSNPRGVIGGGQIGCNQQFDNRWVLGLEADIQGSAERQTRSLSAVNSDSEGFSGNVVAKIRWFGTARARAGVLVTPTILLYGTGGLAYGGVSASTTISTFGLPNVNGTTSIGASKTKVGWTLGGGVEGAFLNWNNWTWKFEYLYIDLGSLSGSGVDPIVGAYSWNAKFTDNIIRVGLNYRIP